MTPDPHKSKLERADEFERDAQIAYRKGDLVFAKELAQHAHYLRMQDQKEKEKTP